MSRIRPNILTVAGFDPSGGAGILADIKTFEQFKCLGIAVVTANTVQTEDKFESVNWIDKELIKKQLTTLLTSYKFEVCKIGLIHDFDFLLEIIELLKKSNPTIKIIWDPILSASAGFNFHTNFKNLEAILKQVHLFTPNWDEVKALTNNTDAAEAAKNLTKHCNIYLKGGHNTENKGKDYLFTTDNTVHPFNPKRISTVSKHGTGCVLSSALAANILQGYTLKKSCLRAKTYVLRVIESNQTLLGYHKF